VLEQLGAWRRPGFERRILGGGGWGLKPGAILDL